MSTPIIGINGISTPIVISGDFSRAQPPDAEMPSVAAISATDDDQGGGAQYESPEKDSGQRLGKILDLIEAHKEKAQKRLQIENTEKHLRDIHALYRKIDACKKTVEHRGQTLDLKV
jgi:hypothetical protein